jgi:membrane-associated phospholipid phosphatase
MARWAALFGVLGYAALAVDVPLARLMAGQWVPGEVEELLERAETFGHAYGALGIGITVLLLDTARRSVGWRLLAASLGAGLAADAVKLLVPRIRPSAFDLTRSVTHSFVSLESNTGSVTWQLALDSSRQSCPSAHTAVAVALAFGLAWMYPRARWWFALLAVLCGMNRVVSGAHFASDVLWGTSVGMIVAAICFRPGTTRRTSPPGFLREEGHHSKATASNSSAPSLSMH